MILKDKIVIITGSSSGIGKALAFQFAKKGAAVVLAARTKSKLDEVKQGIESKGGKALVIQTDVSVKDQVDRLVQRTVEVFGGFDIFINNAGISTCKGNLVDNRLEDIRQTLDTNLMAGIYSTCAAVPILKKRGGGQLVFVTSVVGKRGIPQNAVYCASKFALHGLTEALRLELKRDRIKVITVAPPGVDTPFYENNNKGPRRTFWLHSAEKVAKIIVKACEKEKREVMITMDAKLMNTLNFLLPATMDWAIAKNKKI